MDEQIFHFINSDLSHAVLDSILVPFRDKKNWIPLYILISGFMIWKFKLRSILMFCMIGLLILISDTASSKVIKPWVKKPRPCHTLETPTEMNLRVNCSPGYSFPSSHATNHFAIALFLGSLFSFLSKWPGRLLIVWAAIISFAQVYVGAHYPIDVIIGAVLGSCIAYLVLSLYHYLDPIIYTSNTT